MIKFRKLFLNILFLLILPIELLADDKDKVMLEWDTISFAKEYLVELKDKKGKIFFKKKTPENKIELDLSPDAYEKRITVFNKLGEVDAVSDWTPFAVKFMEGRIKILQKWEKIPNAVIYVLEVANEEGRIVQRRKTESEETELGLNPGNYKKKLVVLNKLGEVEMESEWIPFNVVEIFTPELKDPNKKEIVTIENKNPKVSLDGIHFEPGIEILLESDSHSIPIEDIKIETENKMTVTINVDKAPLGVYRLRMKNTRSKQSSYPYYLKLEKPDKDKLLSKRLENWEILLRSATFAGWGEYFGGETYNNSSHKKRGIVYSGLFVVSGIYFLKLTSDFKAGGKNLEKDAITDIALTAGIPDEFEAAKTFLILNSANNILSNQSSLKSLSQNSLNVSYVLIGIYLIQLVDAYIINRNVNSLYESSSTGLKVDVNRESSSYHFPKPQENVFLYYRFNF